MKVVFLQDCNKWRDNHNLRRNCEGERFVVPGAGGGVTEHLGSLRVAGLVRLELLAPGVEVAMMMSTILVCQRSFMIGIHLVLNKCKQYRAIFHRKCKQTTTNEL